MARKPAIKTADDSTIQPTSSTKNHFKMFYIHSFILRILNFLVCNIILFSLIIATSTPKNTDGSTIQLKSICSQ
jgi:large-conductance mechanosensitive channel